MESKLPSIYIVVGGAAGMVLLIGLAFAILYKIRKE
jgi:hypothetical protein